MRERGEDPTSPSAPEAESLGADFWSTAHVLMSTGKTSVLLTRMNAQKHPITRK